MGKSMSTAKQLNGNVVTQGIKETNFPQKSNQSAVPRVTPMPSRPNAEYLKRANTIDKSFNDRLKQVFVTSANDNPDMNFPKNRLMPYDRSTPYSHMPHSQRADERQPHMLFVDEIKTILVNYKKDPKMWNVNYIAEQFDISKENAAKLVEHYGCLQVFYSHRPSESDKYLQREERGSTMKSSSSLEEIEKEVTAGVEKKWKSKSQAEKEWKDTWKHLPW